MENELQNANIQDENRLTYQFFIVKCAGGHCRSDACFSRVLDKGLQEKKHVRVKIKLVFLINMYWIEILKVTNDETENCVYGWN